MHGPHKSNKRNMKQQRGRSPDLPDDSTVATWNIRSNQGSPEEILPKT